MIDAVGYAGIVLVLVAYALSVRRPFFSNALSGFGALLLIAYGVTYAVWPNVLLNLVWLVIAGHRISTWKVQ